MSAATGIAAVSQILTMARASIAADEARYRALYEAEPSGSTARVAFVIAHSVAERDLGLLDEAIAALHGITP